jgi:hypothetical protein
MRDSFVEQPIYRARSNEFKLSDAAEGEASKQEDKT